MARLAKAPPDVMDALKKWRKEVSAPVVKTEEETQAQAFVDAEEAGRYCTFTFIDADWIRKTELTTIPRYQELVEMEGAVKQLTLHIDDAYRGKYRSFIVTVSHRWEEPDAPDTKGVQFKTIKDYLLSEEGIHKSLLWYDFGSLPQGFTGCLIAVWQVFARLPDSPDWSIVIWKQSGEMSMRQPTL